MPESLESFVKKLQSEGVDAGKEAAEKIKKEAKQKAEKILADAKNEAEEIVAKAKGDAEKQLSRAQTELELAVRDTILKLRESLGRVLSTLLTKRVEKQLADADYLGDIMREVIVAYAKADAGQRTRIAINVSKKMRDTLDDRVLQDLFQNLQGEQDKMGLQATLSKAGFEYKIHGATVEVSAASVSELLSDMVSPALQDIIDKVVGTQGE
jgi:V/A-type H+-transporting ATPase subunit E